MNLLLKWTLICCLILQNKLSICGQNKLGKAHAAKVQQLLLFQKKESKFHFCDLGRIKISIIWVSYLEQNLERRLLSYEIYSLIKYIQ